METAIEDAARQATVLSIQSHTVTGYCGNRCAVFPLQARHLLFSGALLLDLTALLVLSDGPGMELWPEAISGRIAYAC